MSGVGGSPGRGGAGGSGINCVNGSPCPGFCIPGQVYCNGICVIQCQGGGGTTGTAGTGGAAGRGGAGGGAGGAAGGGSTAVAAVAEEWAGLAAASRARATASARASSVAAASASTPATTSSTAEHAGTRAAATTAIVPTATARASGRARSSARPATRARPAAGGGCCTGTQICCTVTLGPDVTGCFEPVNGTCPTGCSGCNCAAPTTPVATPMGDRPIADIKVGDLVYSIDHGSLAIVPIKLVHRQPRNWQPPRRRAEARARCDVEDQPSPSDGGRSSFCRPCGRRRRRRRPRDRR